MISIRKNIFARLFSVHNTISLSRHEQVCLMRLRFERYFSHHRARMRPDDGRSISRNVASLNILVHDVINLLYNDDKCFQYALTVALNYEQIEKDLQRISNIKLFIDQYNWKEIEFPSRDKDWKNFELSNKSIALNILYVTHNTEKIRHAYKSNYNLIRENLVILLMITDGEKWHYYAVKSLSALFRGKASNNYGDFYCLSCFQP